MAGLYTNNNYVPASVMGLITDTGGSQLQMMMHHEMNSPQRLPLPHVYSPDPRYSVYSPLPGSSGYYGVGDGVGCMQFGQSMGMPSQMIYTSCMPGHTSIMTTLSSIAPASVGLGVTAPGSFTFTSPTRHSYVSTPQIHSHPYSQSAISTYSPQTFAPGLGVSWQHTVPQLMPWTETSSTAEPPLFIGSVTYSKPGYTHPDEPKPSCSISPRRPKRHAPDMPDIGSEIPCKVHIGEEKMTASMKGLNLNSDLETCEDTMLVQPEEELCDEINNTGTSSSDTVIRRSWQKFRELEDMLSVDESLNGDPKHPKIHLSTTINRDLLNNNPLIPKNILDELNKPCMQLVLWKPPGHLVKDLASDVTRQDSRRHNKRDGEKKDERHHVQSLTDLCSSMSTSRPISSPTQQVCGLDLNYQGAGGEIMDDDMEL